MSGLKSQLDERQVIELKAKFRDNPELIADVTAHIVDGFMAELLHDEEPWFQSEEDLQAAYKLGASGRGRLTKS